MFVFLLSLQWNSELEKRVIQYYALTTTLFTKQKSQNLGKSVGRVRHIKIKVAWQ